MDYRGLEELELIRLMTMRLLPSSTTGTGHPLSHACAMLDDRDDAVDVVQDVFTSLWKPYAAPGAESHRPRAAER